MNNTKISLTTLIAGATLAFAGVAMAQANPPTSTPGAGCTATANAMRGGNLGSSPSDTACTTAGAKAAAAPAATTTTQAAPAPVIDTSAKTNMAVSSGTGNPAPVASTAPIRVARAARADRN